MYIFNIKCVTCVRSKQIFSHRFWFQFPNPSTPRKYQMHVSRPILDMFILKCNPSGKEKPSSMYKYANPTVYEIVDMFGIQMYSSKQISHLFEHDHSKKKRNAYIR